MEFVDEIKLAISRLPSHERNHLEGWIQDWNAGRYRVEEPRQGYAERPDYPNFSLEEYFLLERSSNVRHEYINGFVRAVSGPSVRHASIATNLLAAIHPHVRKGPCKAYVSDVAVRINTDRDEIFYYPDLLVSCTQEGVEKHWLTRPKLIVEILSPSTESIDRREKLRNYTRIPSVDEYLLVAQERREILLHRRRSLWKPERVTEGAVELESIELSVSIELVYERIE